MSMAKDVQPNASARLLACINVKLALLGFAPVATADAEDSPTRFPG